MGQAAVPRTILQRWKQPIAYSPSRRCAINLDYARTGAARLTTERPLAVAFL
jgi:hypothetical protein